MKTSTTTTRMETTLAVLLVVLATLVASGASSSTLSFLKSLQHTRATQIVQLRPAISVVEELNLAHLPFDSDLTLVDGNLLLFDLRNVSRLHAGANRTIVRLQLLPRDSLPGRHRLAPAAVATANRSAEDTDAKFFIDGFALLTNQTFDREQLIADNQCEETADEDAESVVDCVIRLRIAAYDERNSLAKIFVLPVHVLDINDWRPEFRAQLYRVNISENLAARSVFPLEAPVDADSLKFGVQECEIENNIFAGELNQLVPSSTVVVDQSAGSSKQRQRASLLFDAFYNRNTQRLFLVVNQPLDRENRSQYDLILMCTDGASYARTRLHIDVLDANDNAPVFKRAAFNVSVRENELNASLLRVEATDADDANGPNGQLAYSLPVELNAAEVADGVFGIDESSGELRLLRPLDFESRKKHTIKVKVQDKGPNPVPVYTDVHVYVLDANDHAPQAQLAYSDKYVVRQERSNNTIWIQEETEPSGPNATTILAYLTLSDADSAAANGFNLSAEIASVSFTRTTLGNVEFESESAGGFTFRLVPVIEDAESSYYALELAKRVDREEKLFFDLELKLSDNAAGSTQTQQSTRLSLRVILVDINDNRPLFQADTSFYRFEVTENALELNFAAVRATDADLDANAAIEYQILDENPPELVATYTRATGRSVALPLPAPLQNANYLFFVHPENGSLSLRGPLDRELRDRHVITVRATDHGSSPLSSDVLVEISVRDVNDNAPRFATSSAHFELNENAAAGAVVGSVRAEDADLNASTEYALRPSEMGDFFYVNPRGELVARAPLDAEDRALQSRLSQNGTTFEFQIVARDPELAAASSSEATALNVTVFLRDLNDHQPQIVAPTGPRERLVLVNIQNLTSAVGCEQQAELLRLRAVDLDRDLVMQKTTFKFGSIRRMSWQFVYEIVKSELAAGNKSEAEAGVLAFVEGLVRLQQRHDMRPIAKLNLRSIFALNSTLSGAAQQEEKGNAGAEASLTLNQLCRLNLGVYNFSISAQNDYNETGPRAEVALKLVVLNVSRAEMRELANASTGFGADQMAVLEALVDRWWAQNAAMVANYKRRVESAAISTVALFGAGAGSPGSRVNGGISRVDDNGDDMDGIAQDYYKFYASSAFARLNSSSLLDTSAGLVRSAFAYMLSQSSNSVIVVACAFVLAAALLVSLITYKQWQGRRQRRRTELCLGGGGSGGKMKQKLILASNSSSSSNSSHLDGGDSHADDSVHKYETGSNSECTTNVSSTVSSGGGHRLSQQPMQQQQDELDSASPNLTTSHYMGSTGGGVGPNLASFSDRKSAHLGAYNSSCSASSMGSSASGATSSVINGNHHHHNHHHHLQQPNHGLHLHQHDQAKRYIQQHADADAGSASICDSFTMITSIAAAAGVNDNAAEAVAVNSSSTPTPVPSTTTAAAPVPGLSATFLSTFAPMSSANCYMQPAGGIGQLVVHQQQQHAASIQGNNNQIQCIIAEEDDETSLAVSPPGVYTTTQTVMTHCGTGTGVITDHGYYGSSDYSENNNSYGMIAAQRPSDSKLAKTATATTTAGNSTSSFTSSSLLSSPASSSPGPSTSPVFPSAATTAPTGQFKKSQHVHHLQPRTVATSASKPAVTNMYPLGAYQQQQPAPAEVYFEKFERIYNSDVSSTPTPGDFDAQQHSKISNPYFYTNQQEKAQPGFGATKQRTGLSTYSYV